MLRPGVEGTERWSGACSKERLPVNFADHFDSYRTEYLTDVPAGRIEVRHFSWSRPIDALWETDARHYLLNLPLHSQETATSWVHPQTGLRHSKAARSGLVLIPPGQQFLTRFSTAGSSRSICFLLNATVLEGFLTDAPEWKWNQSLIDDCAQLGGTEVEWLLRRMYREVRGPDFAAAMVLQALAQQVAIEIIRRFKLRRPGSHSRVWRMAPWRMRLIRDRLYSEEPLPGLEEVAALCGLTVRHLTRAFRTETGQTLGRYIESVMVERASALLLARLPVGRVATLLGYAHSGAFARAFRQATGLRPSEIRDEQPSCDAPARLCRRSRQGRAEQVDVLRPGQ
jgi:AraC family transcriptional regulator